MKTLTIQSLKFAKLKRRLKLPHWQAVGLLESLWIFAQVNAPAGDIGRHSNDDIAVSIEWDGNADELIAVLVECGWIDHSDGHRLVIHDWEDHIPKYLKGALSKNGIALATDGIKQPAKAVKQTACEGEQPACNDEQPANVDKQPAPCLSLPFVDKPIHTIPADADASESASNSKRKKKKPKPEPNDHPLFDRFWKAYPRRVKKPKAFAAFRKLNPDEDLLGKMLAAIEVQSHSFDWTKESGRFIPYPASWLNDHGWQDEPPEVSQPTASPRSPTAQILEPSAEELRRIAGDRFSTRLCQGAA